MTFFFSYAVTDIHTDMLRFLTAPVASLQVEMESLKALLGKRINELEEAKTKADAPSLVGPSSAANRKKYNSAFAPLSLPHL